MNVKAAIVANDREVFAANRAVGRIALTVGAEGGISRRVRVHEHGSLRVALSESRWQRARCDDRQHRGRYDRRRPFNIDIAVAAGAGLTVTTAAAEKVARRQTDDLRLPTGRHG